MQKSLFHKFVEKLRLASDINAGSVRKLRDLGSFQDIIRFLRLDLL